MENPIKMDDLGVPLFLETPIFRGYAWLLVSGRVKAKDSTQVGVGRLANYKYGYGASLNLNGLK